MNGGRSIYDARMVKSAPLRRRSSDEVRTLILEAAARGFARRGFDGTTTADIAADCGVAESVLFRHFGSKANLFTAAAVEPFRDAVRGFREFWESEGRTFDDNDPVMHTYIAELYDRIHANRDAVLAMFFAARDSRSDGVGAQSRADFAELLNELDEVGESWAARREFDIPKLWLRTRISVAMVMSMAMFDDWFLPDGPPNGPVDRNTIIEELAGVASRGAISEQHPAHIESTPPG
jgi:AcrR family transcriptional regulator